MEKRGNAEMFTNSSHVLAVVLSLKLPHCDVLVFRFAIVILYCAINITIY